MIHLLQILILNQFVLLSLAFELKASILVTDCLGTLGKYLNWSLGGDRWIQINISY